MFDIRSLPSLDDLGILHGTDKSSLCHGYLRHYGREFDAVRALSINVIEIGVQDGASTRMWRDYFFRAQIIGVDVQERCREFAGERLNIEIGSQADADFLGGLARRHPPTIVIEDGSHRPEHQVFTFEQMFPNLLPGGCYVVEDIHLNREQDREQRLPPGAPWPAAYFPALARHVSHHSLAEDVAAHIRPEIAHLVDRVTAVHGAIMLWRAPPAPQHSADELARLQAAVAARDLHYGWWHFSNFLLARRLDPPMALNAAARAVVLAPRREDYLAGLRRCAEACGDGDAATILLSRAAQQVDEPTRSRIMDLRNDPANAPGG